MNVQRLLTHDFPVIEQSYDARFTSLYALTAGYGQDPLDEDQLQYVYGGNPKTTGSMALVLANPGFWQQEAWTGIDWVRCVLGEQRLTVHKPFPPSGHLISQLRVTDVVDKGKRFGALLYSQRTLSDAITGEHYATLSMMSICRGDGGSGRQSSTSTALPVPPDRPHDFQCEMPTLYQHALLFDLHGIVNPIHSLPAIALKAGYPKPILHGICSFGLVHHGLVRQLGAYDADVIQDMAIRFRGPVYPGETLQVSAWLSDDRNVIFEVYAKERRVLAMHGIAELVTARD